jgi:hypothetical protein
MTDERGTDADSEQVNPYEPGESAVDPAEASEAGPPGRIAESDPPSSPSLGRWLTNLPVVSGRMIGPVGLAWLVLLVGAFVLMLGVGSIFAFSFLSGKPEAGGAASHRGIAMAALPVGLVLEGAFGIAWFGPFRPLRRVAFRGPGAVASLGEALGMSVERKWSVAGLTIVLIYGYSVLTGGLIAVFVVAFGSLEQGLLGAVVLASVSAASLVPAAPAVYLVSATDAGLMKSIGTGTDLLTSRPGYLIGGLLGVAGVFLVGVVGVPAVLIAGSFVLLVEPVGWVLAALWSPLGLWVTAVTFATLFATLEEATGRFQR